MLHRSLTTAAAIVALSPMLAFAQGAEPLTEDALTATVEVSDPDDDSFYYETMWFVDGIPVYQSTPPTLVGNSSRDITATSDQNPH